MCRIDKLLSFHYHEINTETKVYERTADLVARYCFCCKLLIIVTEILSPLITVHVADHTCHVI